MKILVVSDTHGELDNVNKIVEKFKGRDIDIVIHLGDDSPDAEPLKNLGKPLYVVPGVYEPHYKNPDTVRRMVINVEGLKILLSHTETKHQNDPPEEEDPLEKLKNTDINMLFHGHTHIPKVVIDGRKIILNPGHLKKSDKKGYPPTYAIVDIDKSKIRITIHKLEDDTPILNVEISRTLIG